MRVHLPIAMRGGYMRGSTGIGRMIAVAAIFLIASCSPEEPEGWVLVRGGHARIGDGVTAAEYEADIADFLMAPRETTNAEVAVAYNWAFGRGFIEAFDGRVKPSKKYVPSFIYPFIDLRPAAGGLVLADGKLSPKPGREREPALWVSWYGCAAYCNFLSAMQGRSPVYDVASWEIMAGKNGYRLPSDAEWEYAARGGLSPSAFRYAGSDDPEAVAWFLANSGGVAHETGLKAPNSLGLFDMSGNASEYVTEILAPLKSTASTPGYVWKSANRIWRGGSYLREAQSVFGFAQLVDWPNFCVGFEDVGFRVILPGA